MNDTMVTVVGNVADSPRRVRLKTGAVTNFRLASTRRRYDAGAQGWVDADTFWVDVECWNELGGNVSRSVSKGDPVIVLGRLYTDSWETENGRRSTSRIRAYAVGPNLTKGSADFTKTPRPERLGAGDVEPDPVEPTPDEEELAHALTAEREGDAEGLGVGDYTEGSGPLYETDTGSFPQPARA